MPANLAHDRSNRYPRQLLGLLLLGVLVHLIFGGLLGFSVDEAHYALYADKLDWSYFDHPPLVGWIQWPLVALGAPIGVMRLIPEALWLISCLLVWQLARDPRLPAVLRRDNNVETDEQRHWAGLWAVVLQLLAPVMHVLSVGLLPDTLLMVVTLLLMRACLALLALTDSRQIQLKQWLTLGALMGLAGLSKYTAVFSAAATALILIQHFGLGLFKRAGLWIAILLAILMVSPVFYWNFIHQWISFAYQIQHGSGGDWQLKRFILFFLIQFGAFGPLLVGSSFIALGLAIKQKNGLALWLMLFFALPFAVTAWLSGGGGLPHWTAPAWLAASPFAARLIAQDWFNGRQRLIKVLLWIQSSVCLLAFTLLFYGGIPGVAEHDGWGKKNPFADLWGWDPAASVAKDLAVKLGYSSISVGNWTLASRMAWYAKPTVIHVLDDRLDQFDLWFGQTAPDSDTIFVNWSQMTLELPVGGHRFKTCELISSLPIMRMNREISHFDFYDCKHWGGQP